MKLSLRDKFYVCEFTAMASSCEVFFAEKKATKAEKMAEIVLTETQRLENKYSRYQVNSITSQINAKSGQVTQLDEETYQLLAYAKNCYDLSDGLFDITTGVLRHLWKESHLPSQEQLEAIKTKIGFQKIDFDRTKIRMPQNMEIDFGGIVKEYAVDKVAMLLRERNEAPILVNFGGDLFSDGKGGHIWNVGVESTKHLGTATTTIEFVKGGLATSGSTRRYFEKNGKRYGHIFDPFTLNPSLNAPLSVTVLASTCTEAGFLSTLAMLKGEKAERFLKSEGYRHWVQR
jgi:thiamine biosynthesis lipoprotein